MVEDNSEEEEVANGGEEEGDTEEENDAKIWEMLDKQQWGIGRNEARALVGMVRREAERKAQERIPEGDDNSEQGPAIVGKDLMTLSKLLLRDVFGDRAHAKLATIYKEASAPGYLFDNRIHKVAQEIAGEGQPELASFVRAVGDNDSGRAAIGHVVRMHGKAKMWLLWRHYRGETPETQPALAEYLDRKGFGNGTLQDRVGDFLVYELKLKTKVHLRSRIHMASGIGLLVEKFGLGVVVFLPKSTNTAFKSLHTGLLTKGERFSLFLDALDIHIEGLRERCTAAETAVLDPLLRRQTLLPSVGWQLVCTGKRDRVLDKVRRLSMLELLELGPVGTVL